MLSMNKQKNVFLNPIECSRVAFTVNDIFLNITKFKCLTKLSFNSFQSCLVKMQFLQAQKCENGKNRRGALAKLKLQENQPCGFAELFNF